MPKTSRQKTVNILEKYINTETQRAITNKTDLHRNKCWVIKKEKEVIENKIIK